jgi:hypothetical protein
MGKGGETTFHKGKESKFKVGKIIYSKHDQFSEPIIKINGCTISSKFSKPNVNRRNTTRDYDSIGSITRHSSRIIRSISNDTYDECRGNEDVQTKGKSNLMDKRHNKRTHTNFSINSSGVLALLGSHNNSRKLFNLQQAILTFFKKIRIPFTAVSSSFLFANISYAQSFIERGDVSKGKFSSEQYGDQSTWEKLSNAADAFMGIVNWFKNFGENIADLSVELFSKVFELITFLMLQTPSVIFSGEYISKIIPSFSLISVSIIILATIYESIMMMLRKKHTKGEKILKRMPFAIGVAGITPFLFEKGFKMLNKLTIGITKLSGGVFDPNFLKGIANAGFIDSLGLLAFDVALVVLAVPLVMQNARRWWDLFVLCCISPLALSAYIFDRHRHLYESWITAIKKKATVQLVYATFISLLGLFIFSTRLIAPDMWAIKLLLVLGALNSLANPPSLVKSYMRGENLDNNFEKVYKNKIPSLGKVNLMAYYNSQKKSNQKKAALRQKNKRRFVDDLL